MGFSFFCGIILRLNNSPEEERELVQQLTTYTNNLDIPFIWNITGSTASGLPEAGLLSAGKRGLPHPLLNGRELKEELLLSSGISGGLPPYVFPRIPDTSRSSALDLYRKRKRIIFTRDDSLLIYREADTLKLPCLTVDTVSGKKDLNRRIRELRKKAKEQASPAVIILNCLDPAQAYRIISLLPGALTKFRIQAAELKELLNIPVTSEPDGERLSPPAVETLNLDWDPLSCSRRAVPWETPGESRLILLAGAGTDPAEGNFSMDGVLRDLIANMPGEVLMYEGAATALFNRGDIVSFYSNKRNPVVAGPCRAFISCSSAGQEGRTVCSVRRIGTFSFDDYPARGLRDSLAITAPGFNGKARIIRDFFFVSGDPRLCISFYIHFPEISDPELTVKSFGLLEIPVSPPRNLKGKDKYSVMTHYPENETGVYGLSEEGEYLLHGTGFTVPAAEGMLHINYGDTHPVVRELHVAVRKGILYLNPWGSYGPFPGRLLSGLKQQFSIILSLNEEPAEGLAPLRPHLESYRIFKEPVPTYKR